MIYVKFTRLLSALLWLHIACLAHGDISIKRFLESAYKLPYAFDKEMTDIVLVNAYLTNQSQIRMISQNVAEFYATKEKSKYLGGALAKDFNELGLTNTANIQLFRERSYKDFYRLDMAPPLQSFTDYCWVNGELTNGPKFLLSEISIPPEGDDLWKFYAIQPHHNNITIETGKAPLLRKEGFYLDLFGLPPLLRLNIFIQTAELNFGRIVKPSINDPDGFRHFRIDEKRLTEMLSGESKFGKWTILPVRGNEGRIKQFSFIGPDGADHGNMRVFFSESKPERLYLAYVRDPKTGHILSLFAWDYDELGVPVRFLKIGTLTSGVLQAWARNIIHFDKTDIVDHSLFEMNISNYKSIYDKRPDRPIQIENGVVVYEAGKTSKEHASQGMGLTFIRIIMIVIFLLPIAFLAMYKRKRKSH